MNRKPDFIYLGEQADVAYKIETLLKKQGIPYTGTVDETGTCVTFRFADDSVILVRQDEFISHMSVSFPASREIQNLLTMQIRAWVRQEPLLKTGLTSVKWED